MGLELNKFKLTKNKTKTFAFRHEHGLTDEQIEKKKKNEQPMDASRVRVPIIKTNEQRENSFSSATDLIHGRPKPRFTSLFVQTGPVID